MHSANSSDNSEEESASALLCILLEIVHTAEKRKQRGAGCIFLEFTPSGGSSARSIPFIFGALHYFIVLLCKVNLFLEKKKKKKKGQLSLKHIVLPGRSGGLIALTLFFKFYVQTRK